MTKEPIMIDDVDVSECENLYTTNLPIGNDKIKCGLHQGKTCDNYPNCYYKQLKHKEQEYNRLSNLITSTKTYEITCLDCRDAILTAPTISGRTKFSQIEIEEISLKMIIKQLKDKEQECEELKIDNKEQKRQLRVRANILKLTNEKNNELKQALQEIKGIVFELKKIVKSYKFDKYTSQILQKCEVIRVENENEPKR